MTTQHADDVTEHHRRPTAVEFYSRNRGGGLFTTLVNQRIGSYLCVPSHRLNLPPTVLTLANLVIGIGGSVAAGTVPADKTNGRLFIATLAAFMLWQLAYSLDCADGQLARLIGKTSSAGARLDVLCDGGVQASMAIAICYAATKYSPDMPRWLPPAFGCAFVVNLFISASIQRGRAAGSLFHDNGVIFVRVASLVLDHGILITAFAATLAFAPTRVDDLMMLFVLLNVMFHAARIGSAAWASIKLPNYDEEHVGGPGYKPPERSVEQ